MPRTPPTPSQTKDIVKSSLESELNNILNQGEVDPLVMRVGVAKGGHPCKECQCALLQHSVLKMKGRDILITCQVCNKICVIDKRAAIHAYSEVVKELLPDGEET